MKSHPALSFLALSTLVALASGTAMGALVPTNLRCEYRVNPMGIDATQPRLSWTLESGDPSARSQRQTAWQVLVAATADDLAADRGTLWDSGRIESDQSIHVQYAGKPLTSGQDCWWKARVWDQQRTVGEWSRPAHWTMGLLQPSDWKGKWIGLDADQPNGTSNATPLANSQWIWMEPNAHTSAPVGTRYFRRPFALPVGSVIRKATCWITADNSFTLFINGQRAGANSNFSQISEIDVTAHVQPGENVVSVSAANLGDKPNPAGLIAALRIDLDSGAPVVIITDEQWRASDKETAGWERTQFDDQTWAAAKRLGKFGMAPWGAVSSDDRTYLVSRMLRREFQVQKPIRRATAYVCGLGLFELHLNGQKIGDHVLEPALTEYDKRTFYVTFDVTSQLKQGANAVGVILGNGRYFAPRAKVPTATRTYGFPKLLLQMDIEYADGSKSQVLSDESWKLTTNSPIRGNNEYDGEEYDARMEMPGWDQAGFADSAWQQPQLVKGPGGVLAAQMMEPIRVTQTIHPVAITSPKPGAFIFDMGQNMVGWCRLMVTGPRGTTVSLRHSETLRPDGTLYLDNIRSARVTDTYALKGEGTEIYEPRFVFHGFRYVEVSGFPGEPTLSSIEGKVVHDAVPPAGEFACSNELLNRIYRNIVWGVRGNYRSIPTDCPQRDERQGWLGDRSAESKGETYLFNVAGFYGKWIQDMTDAQRQDGAVPDVAPSYWPFYNDNITWPSSFIIIPGALYDQYADVQVIRSHYPAMKRWIAHMRSYMRDDLMPRDTYGDWCVPPEEQHLIHSNDPKRKTAGEILGTCYFYHDLRLMARYARLLGNTTDATEYDSLADRMKAAFNRKYFQADAGYYDNGSQTSCVLPLAFGLTSPEQRRRVFEHLVSKIRTESKDHVGTGLVGGQWLMRVLSDNGRADLAYTLAAQKSYPSWGYMVEKGATTIWELWNGDTADPAMNSGNHVMLVGDLNIWFHEYLAGIRPDPDRPGFKHISIRPHPVGDLTSARASHKSPYGTIRSEWRVDAGRITLKVVIPPNTTATIYLPAKDPATATESGKPAAQSPGVTLVRSENGAAIYEVGSGEYTFSATR